MEYLPRALDHRLDTLLSALPAVAIDGAKGVGKTATAMQRASTVIRLDDRVQVPLIEADPNLLDLPAGTVLLDEWQLAPYVWDSVRRRVDDGAPPGRFLMTGSATPVSERGTHSGAGRIVSLRMRPMALFERGVTTPTVSLSELLSGDVDAVSGEGEFRLKDYVATICRSGFPGIARLNGDMSQEQLDSYIARIIDRDLPANGVEVRRPETLRRWMTAYAAVTSTTTQYSKILDASTSGDGSQPAKDTTIVYRDHLSAIWILDPVPGWIPANNPLKRLTQAPKHQLADPALAARLLGLNERTLLQPRGQHMLGPLFEALAVLTVRVAADAVRARVSHLREKGGEREIDLIVEGANGELLAIEVKLAQAVDDHDVRHLLWLRDRLSGADVQLMVINAGPRAYRRQDGVVVVPLDLLGA